MAGESTLCVARRNVTSYPAQKRNQMLVEKLVPQWLSTMTKEQIGKGTIFRIVEGFIGHASIFLPSINGIGCILGYPDPELSTVFIGGNP